jgi:hypothetical protein
MRTRNCLRWGLLSIFSLALLTVWAQTGRPQPSPGTTPPPLSDGKANVPSISLPPPELKPLVSAPTPAPTPTVEDLIKQLELLRKEKAELEKREKDVIAKLQERMKEHTDRLNKLGIIIPAPHPPQPDAKDNVDVKSPPPRDFGSRDKDKN